MASPSVYKSPNLNAKNTGSIFLFNNLPFSFGATKIMFHCLTADSITVPPTISVGTNAPDYDNIFAAQQLPGLTAEKEYMSFPLDNQLLNDIPANTPIYANISQAAQGTAQTITINVEGEPL